MITSQSSHLAQTERVPARVTIRGGHRLWRVAIWMIVVQCFTNPALAEVRQVTPESGLQVALDQAAAGDILLLAPGVYYERVLIRKGGTPEKPLIIRAENPGTAVISGADPDWDRQQPPFKIYGKPHVGVYETPLPYPVWAAMSDDRILRRCQSLSELCSDDPRAGPAASSLNEGFYWKDGTFYLRARDPAKPGRIQILRECLLDIDVKPIRDGHLWQTRAIYLLPDADHVTIEGLRIHLGGNVGIEMLEDLKGGRAPDHITIRDCHFTGCRYGICTTRGLTNTRNLLVEHCEYGFWPCFDWSWRENYDCARFMVPSINNMTIRHNLIYDTFDPFQFRSPHQRDDYEARHIDVHHNLLYRIKDDAFELEYNQPMFVRVHHNVVADAHCFLAVCPNPGGGGMIDHNVAWHCTMMFKCAKYSTEWPVYGMTIVHNTLCHRPANWVLLFMDNACFRECLFENNLFLNTNARSLPPWKAHGLFPGEHNLYQGSLGRPKQAVYTATTKNGSFTHTPLFCEQPGVLSMEPFDWRLQADSPAIDAGADGDATKALFYQKQDYVEKPTRPDIPPLLQAADGLNRFGHPVNGKAAEIGAVEFGREWVFPRPGPRWVKPGSSNMHRPPFSAKINWTLVGFEAEPAP